ncbi:regulator of protease activity HflC (stomatin/prohibitin superfamily) [Mobiluncus mulieris]|uniref:Uncharacterized protein n=2 Tax=Mobiluncus mulieris TaxID=2052 RepID=A0A8G2HU21_9ACTO|nr:hypothetical protein [Mobiluncus mulieris]MBB5845735.1 regulator of protease activity HflC (stomatin/prohibitin superfamily) [Mobiluncus mulieris]STO15603.1 Uncharacterised protein [Mobiluncus mulieris]
MDRKKPTGVALALFIVSGLLCFGALVLLGMSLFIPEFDRGWAPKLGNSSALLGVSLLLLGFAIQRKPSA